MRCSIWRDIKKSSGTMIVDTGCCWCSVPSSLIIRVPSFSHIKRWNRRIPLSPFPLSLACLVYSHFLSLCSITVLCLLPTTALSLSKRYYHIVSHIHILSSFIVIDMSSPLLLLFSLSRFPLDGAVSFSRRCFCVLRAATLWVFPLLLLRFFPPGYASVFAFSLKKTRKTRFLLFMWKCLLQFSMNSVLLFYFIFLYFHCSEKRIINLLNKLNQARA